jgi:hypothetical protein
VLQEKALGIKSIQIIYNMEFSRKMITKIKKLAMDVKEKLEKRDKLYVVKDLETYRKLKHELIENYEAFEDLRKKFLNDPKFRKALSTKVAIVEFKME